MGSSIPSPYAMSRSLFPLNSGCPLQAASPSIFVQESGMVRSQAAHHSLLISALSIASPIALQFYWEGNSTAIAGGSFVALQVASLTATAYTTSAVNYLNSACPCSGTWKLGVQRALGAQCPSNTCPDTTWLRASTGAPGEIDHAQSVDARPCSLHAVRRRAKHGLRAALHCLPERQQRILPDTDRGRLCIRQLRQ